MVYLSFKSGGISLVDEMRMQKQRENEILNDWKKKKEKTLMEKNCWCIRISIRLFFKKTK